MKALISIFNQSITTLIKRTEQSVRPVSLTFEFGYNTFEGGDFKILWSRHLESFNDALFVDSRDPLTNNIFNPFKKIIRLNDLQDRGIVYYIITSFENLDPKRFERLSYFIKVIGFKESFVMVPETAHRAASVLLALKTFERKEGNEEIR